MMYSLYGGRQGKDFKISKIFSNRVALEQDLNLGYYSTVGVGEIVCISYGLQNDKKGQYKNNKEIDLNRYGKTYNLTFWEKVYGNETNEVQEDKVQEDNRETVEIYTNSEIDTKIYQINSGISGFGYRLIGSSTGNTPKFTVETIKISPASEPEVDIKPDNIDNPTLIFNLPASVKFYVGDGYAQATEKNVLCHMTNNDGSPLFFYNIEQLKTIKNTNIFDENREEFLMHKGDIYIDSITGNMYQYNGATDDGASIQYEFEYQGRNAREDITAVIEWYPQAFDETGKLNEPDVDVSYANETQQIGRKLTFKFPPTPTAFNATAETIPYTTKPEISIQPIEGKSGYSMHMQIPQGEPIQIIDNIRIDLKPSGGTKKVEDEIIAALFEDSDTKGIIEELIKNSESFREGKGGIGINYYKIDTNDEGIDIISDSISASYLLILKDVEVTTANNEGKEIVDSITKYTPFLLALSNLSTFIVNEKDSIGDASTTYSTATINKMIADLQEEINVLTQQLTWQPPVEQEGGQTEE